VSNYIGNGKIAVSPEFRFELIAEAEIYINLFISRTVERTAGSSCIATG
jgi:hypothetical protein